MRALLPALFLSANSLAYASGEAVVNFDRVSLTSSRYGITINVSHEKELAKLTVKAGDKTIAVPDRFLFGAKHANMDSIRLIANPSNPGQSFPNGLIGHGYVVSFEFGGSYEHGEEKGKKVQVYRVVRIYFSEKGVEKSELAIPTGDFRNEWHFHEMSVDGASEEPMKQSAVNCPWTGVPARLPE